MTLERRTVWLVTAGTFFAFFLFGFADNLKGPTLPALLQDLNYTYSQGGTLLFVVYVGFLVATLFTGVLADVAGKKAILLLAGVCLLLGMGGYSTQSAFGWLAAAIFILGLGLGALEIGGNTVVVDLHGEQKGRYLNLLAVFHGLGSLVAPVYAGQMLAAGLTWRQVYQVGLLLVVILPLYFIIVPYPRRQGVERSGLDWRGLGQAAFSKQMIGFYVMIALYVAAEIGLASWLVEYLQKIRGLSVVVSTAFLSLFFGCIMAGRFLGSFVVERIGYMKSMLLVSLAASACLAVGMFGPAFAVVCLPLSGLFFSIHFPTATAAVSDLHKENLGTVLGVFFAAGGVGGMIGPWLIGLMSDWQGITAGLSLVLAFYVLVFSALLVLRRIKSN